MKVRRVIVGLPPEPRSRTVLEDAARLALRMQAELVGMFLEDVNLLHFAALPCAREVGIASAMRRELDVPCMERSLRALAEETRRALEAVAARVAVRWSFRVARVAAAADLLAQAEEEDLVVADIGQTIAIERPVPVRFVPAGDPEALRAALEAGGGILVLAGPLSATGETLRRLLEGD
jgi:hypothetical protein